MTSYTEDELNAIVHPIDVFSQYHDHAAKQAMALGDLRQSKGTLRYLQNQKQALDRQEESTPDTCVVCLLPLDGECCVLTNWVSFFFLGFVSQIFLCKKIHREKC